ncbi:hypothetical protein OSTOST_22700, partial [Ostertagia ostertagi]
SQFHSRRDHFIVPNATPPKRCTVIGTDSVDEDMEALLNLGPSFAIATAVTQDLCVLFTHSLTKFDGENIRALCPRQIIDIHFIDTVPSNVSVDTKTSTCAGIYTDITPAKPASIQHKSTKVVTSLFSRREWTRTSVDNTYRMKQRMERHRFESSKKCQMSLEAQQREYWARL